MTFLTTFDALRRRPIAPFLPQNEGLAVGTIIVERMLGWS